MAEQRELAEFKVLLPGGGYFHATWPRSITVSDLKMLQRMLDLTLDWWIEKGEQERAGELEYASWLPVPAGVAPCDGGKKNG